MPHDHLDRRQLLRLGLTLPLPYLFAACGDGSPDRAARPATTGAGPAGTAAPEGATTLALTPECDDGDGPTPPQTAGPFFTPGSPPRASLLEPGMAGTRLVLGGTVVSAGCRPVARALLDFWQAGHDGQYDNDGFRLRGHQFTDDQGRYRLETVVPGHYAGRTRHIHVKVQAPGASVLTTQLYFPGDPRNRDDGLYRPELLIDVRNVGDAQEGSFTFVVRT